MVVEVNESGKIIGSLQGSKGVLKMISETQQVGDHVFFGSPYADFLGKLHISKIGKRKRPVSSDSKFPASKPKTTKAKEEL